jgi:hypothetical protein
MDKRVYFDTNAFRAIGKALDNAALSADLRDRVLVSPLRAFEVLSQLCTTQGEEVLRQIQAIHNWVDPKRAGLLPWPDDALGITGFGKKVMDADFTQRMQTGFNVCLAADSVESLKEEACKLGDVIEAMKLKFAQNFGRLLKAVKTEASKREFKGGGHKAGRPGNGLVFECLVPRHREPAWSRAKLAVNC